MSMRLFAVLFAALFIIGALPIFFLQPFGSASAGVTAGFMVPIEDLYHVAPTIAIGLLSAWIGEDVMLLMPLCVLLMVSIGAFMDINQQHFHAVQGFLIGAIMLFAMCVGTLKRKANLLWILPFSLWAYFSGSGYMQNIPTITTPLFFLIGLLLSSALLLAIGMTLGITVTDNVRLYLSRVKTSAAYTTFLSLF